MTLNLLTQVCKVFYKKYSKHTNHNATNNHKYPDFIAIKTLVIFDDFCGGYAIAFLGKPVFIQVDVVFVDGALMVFLYMVSLHQ